MKHKKYVITMLVENEPGVTARVTGLFAGRGYNIETICGAPTADPELSRITITTLAEATQFAQCMKQIERLTNVIKLRNMTGEEAVKREMAMICVNVEPEQRDTILKIMEKYHGKVIDIGSKTLTMEVTGQENDIDDFIVLMHPFGIVKLARSGVLALYREA